MAGYSKVQVRTKRRNRKLVLLLLLDFMLIILYLYGQVEIGLNIRANAELKKENQSLESDIDGLNAELIALKSYSRIMDQVEAYSLSPVAPGRIGELQVDLDGAFESDWGGEALQYASMTSLLNRMRITRGN